MLLSVCIGMFGCNSEADGTTGTIGTTGTLATSGTTSSNQGNNGSNNNNSNSNNGNNSGNNDSNNNGGNNMNNNETNNNQGSSSLLSELDLNRFDINKFVYPIWKTDVSFAEASFVRESSSGEVLPLQLLYPITKIVSVRSSDLKTLYVEGVDYNITSDGKIEIIRTGSIPVLKYSDYYKPNYSEVADNLKTVFPAADPNDKGGYIRAEVGTNNPGMARWTIAVTYEHDAASVVSVPETKSQKFTNLINKLEAGEDIKVVSLGDSITDGWSSSSKVDIAPFSPSYNRMVCKYIETEYDIDVNHVNLAVSGSNAGSGDNNGRGKVAAACAENPDLVFVAFGMNDGCGRNTSTYIGDINYIVGTIEQNCPNAAIVVVGTCLPNDEVGFSAGSSILKYHIDYIDVLKNAEKNTWKNAVFADVTTANIELFERKVYQDVAGSNSNHPNDYMHRIYAQVILQTMFGDYAD